MINQIQLNSQGEDATLSTKVSSPYFDMLFKRPNDNSQEEESTYKVPFPSVLQVISSINLSPFRRQSKNDLESSQSIPSLTPNNLYTRNLPLSNQTSPTNNIPNQLIEQKLQQQFCSKQISPDQNIPSKQQLQTINEIPKPQPSIPIEQSEFQKFSPQPQQQFNKNILEDNQNIKVYPQFTATYNSKDEKVPNQNLSANRPNQENHIDVRVLELIQQLKKKPQPQTQQEQSLPKFSPPPSQPIYQQNPVPKSDNSKQPISYKEVKIDKQYKYFSPENRIYGEPFISNIEYIPRFMPPSPELNLEKDIPTLITAQQFKSVGYESGFKNQQVMKGKLSRQKEQEEILAKNRDVYSFSNQKPMIIKQPVLTRFQLISILMKNTLSDIYLARERSSNVLVALKVIYKRSLIEKNLEREFKQEIELQMQLNHPNILKMYGIYDDELRVYLVLEYANGGDLLNHLQKFRLSITESKVSKIIGDVIFGVNYLHSNEIIHRDLKPENIVIVNGIAKITDFGNSCRFNQRLTSNFSGSLCYLAPELFLRNEMNQYVHYDQQIDIWAIGSIAYELLFGYTLFSESSSQEQLIQNILNKEIRIPWMISPYGQQFFTQTLNKNPELRLTSDDAIYHSWIVYDIQTESVKNTLRLLKQ